MVPELKEGTLSDTEYTFSLSCQDVFALMDKCKEGKLKILSSIILIV